MALSEQTRDNVDAAISSIRAALRSASVNERPYIVKELSKCLWSLHQLDNCDQVLDMVEDLKHDIE